MSKLGMEAFADCLSAKPGMQLINIKFLRGTNDVITPEEFKAELCAAAARKLRGEVVPGPVPRWKDAKTNVRDFVAKL